MSPIRCVVEAVQNGQFAGGIQLEKRAVASSPSIKRRAVQIAGRVTNQTGIWILPVRHPSETMQQGQLAFATQLEDGSKATVGAAVLRGAVKIARLVSKCRDTPLTLRASRKLCFESEEPSSRVPF
jgi:hypothetical protein